MNRKVRDERPQVCNTTSPSLSQVAQTQVPGVRWEGTQTETAVCVTKAELSGALIQPQLERKSKLGSFQKETNLRAKA